MFIFENFLRNEYFPSELPPCFNTQSFADIHEVIFKSINVNEKNWTSPIVFYGYKSEFSRRRFSIPHPESYAKISKFVFENENDLKKIFNSKYSLTAPTQDRFSNNEVYARRSKNIKDTNRYIQSLYKSNVIELRLDIQQFFDSIYTHVIPWSIHSKSVAKSKIKDNKLLGNNLDRLLQSMNNGQTNGILTGNAISRLVSEIILCKVDAEISKKLPTLDFIRYADDYYIYLPSNYRIPEILYHFRNELSKYELLINENKIKITESPFVSSDLWIHELKLYSNFNPDILLAKSINLYKKENNIKILRYSLKKLRTISFSKSEWIAIEPIVLNLLVSFPSLSNIISLILMNNKEYLNINFCKKVLFSIIDTCIENSLDEELIWNLWIVKILEINLINSNFSKILKTRNWLAIILALDISKSKHNELGVKKEIDKFRDEIISEYFHNIQSDDDIKKSMYTDIWLLAYEAEKLSLLKTLPNIDFEYASKVTFFNTLMKNDVGFYNPNYRFEDLSPSTKTNFYVTHKELNLILNEYSKLNNKDSIVDDISNIFEKAKDIIENNDEY